MMVMMPQTTTKLQQQDAAILSGAAEDAMKDPLSFPKFSKLTESSLLLELT
jgi:hypothetical protein